MILFKKSMKQWSDSRLLQELYDGNQDAIVYFFYEKFSSSFQYHIYNIFPYKVDVEELVDEFFLYMFQDDWRRMRTYDPEKAALSTWISMVSYRFFKNYKDTKIDFNGVVTISDKWESFRGDWAASHDAGILMDIEDAISAIRNERDREIAHKIFIEDASFESVAEQFDLDVNYVYTVKNRLVKQLKQKLNTYSYE